MKGAYNADLSVDLYDIMKYEKLAKSFISSMAKSLERQFDLYN
jgi:hypothetical protein